MARSRQREHSSTGQTEIASSNDLAPTRRHRTSGDPVK